MSRSFKDASGGHAKTDLPRPGRISAGKHVPDTWDVVWGPALRRYAKIVVSRARRREGKRLVHNV